MKALQIFDPYRVKNGDGVWLSTRANFDIWRKERIYVAARKEPSAPVLCKVGGKNKLQ